MHPAAIPLSMLSSLTQAADEPAAKRGWLEGAPPQALAGLSAVYAALIQPKFQLKVDFLRGLLKRLRSGSCLATAGAAEADLRLLNFCSALVAGLPYRRGDEPCLVVQVGLRHHHVPYDDAHNFSCVCSGPACISPQRTLLKAVLASENFHSCSKNFHSCAAGDKLHFVPQRRDSQGGAEAVALWRGEHLCYQAIYTACAL